MDTAIPTALAQAAKLHAPDKRGVVVQGRYGHVSFIIDPAPLRVTVREVVPPYPPKLLDQTRRVLDLAEHLPPIELVPDVVELDQLARSRTSPSYLLPCRGGGVSIEGATTDYLDEHPDRRPWTLIGCERSQQIHEWFYGERAEQVDICPRKRTGGTGAILDQVLPARDPHRGRRRSSRRAVGSLADPDFRGTDDPRRRVGADVGTRLSDSEQYAHLWGTAELAQVFEERARLQSWLDILTALAAAQARLGIIPAEAAAQIATTCPRTASRPPRRGRGDPADLALDAGADQRAPAGASR